MPDPIQELLAAGAVPTSALPSTSRYAGTGIRVYMTPAGPGREGRAVPFLGRRVCPPTERFTTLYDYVVVEADRRDLVAARHIGDPELWWRIADANAVIDAARMTEPVGRRLRITLPEGVPGTPDV